MSSRIHRWIGFRTTLGLSALLLGQLTGCKQEARSPQAQLDAIDASFAQARQSLQLAKWNEAIGAEAPDLTQREEILAAHLRDPAIDAQLAQLARDRDPELSRRAQAWIEFRRAGALGQSPRLLEIARALDAGIGDQRDESNARPLLALLYGTDAGERSRGLAALTEKTARVAPLLVERAAILQAEAQRLGAASYAALAGYPATLAELQQTCRRQVEQTEPGWQALLLHARAQEPSGVGLADYLALATAWTKSAGALFKSRDLPRLARSALAKLGFDLDALAITIVSRERPGGSAFGISIPEDVRFTGHFPDGYDGARGYFHELGHAVHMKLITARHLPWRLLPSNAGMNEGIGEVFTLALRDRAWLVSELQGVSGEQLDGLQPAVAAFDAVATRLNCLHALTVLALYEGVPWAEAFRAALHTSFEGTEAAPVFVLTPYIDSPLLVVAYVYALDVKLEFERRLGARRFLSAEGGAFLRQTLLEPGNALTLDGWRRAGENTPVLPR